LVRLLAQEHLSASERELKSKTPEAKAITSRLQTALGELDEVDL
jgi:hypothetical protein